jgi:hypothetical protein
VLTIAFYFLAVDCNRRLIGEDEYYCKYTACLFAFLIFSYLLKTVSKHLDESRDEE